MRKIERSKKYLSLSGHERSSELPRKTLVMVLNVVPWISGIGASHKSPDLFSLVSSSLALSTGIRRSEDFICGGSVAHISHRKRQQPPIAGYVFHHLRNFDMALSVPVLMLWNPRQILPSRQWAILSLHSSVSPCLSYLCSVAYLTTFLDRQI